MLIQNQELKGFGTTDDTPSFIIPGLVVGAIIVAIIMFTSERKRKREGI